MRLPLFDEKVLKKEKKLLKAISEASGSYKVNLEKKLKDSRLKYKEDAKTKFKPRGK